MIETVTIERSTYAPPPSRFEAGTPAIAEAIGLGAAADYLGDLGMDRVRLYEKDIGLYLYEQVRHRQPGRFCLCFDGGDCLGFGATKGVGFGAT